MFGPFVLASATSVETSDMEIHHVDPLPNQNSLLVLPPVFAAVAIQCLESAYNISSSDAHLLPSRTLVQIFEDAVKGEPVQVSVVSLPDALAKAVG